MKKRQLTIGELDIMNILWDSERPLIVSEIVSSIETDKSVQSNYYRIINSLKKKEYIKEMGSVIRTRTHATLYAPTISREEYFMHNINNKSPLTIDSVTNVVASFLEKTDKETARSLVDNLEKIILEMKD